MLADRMSRLIVGIAVVATMIAAAASCVIMLVAALGHVGVAADLCG